MESMSNMMIYNVLMTHCMFSGVWMVKKVHHLPSASLRLNSGRIIQRGMSEVLKICIYSCICHLSSWIGANFACLTCDCTKGGGVVDIRYNARGTQSWKSWMHRINFEQMSSPGIDESTQQHKHNHSPFHLRFLSYFFYHQYHICQRIDTVKIPLVFQG